MADGSELIRTNVRLRRDLHASLKTAARLEGDTVESYVANILERVSNANQLGAEPASLGTLESRRLMEYATQLRVLATDLEQLAKETAGTWIDRNALDFAIGAPIPMVIKQRSSGNIITANPAYVRLVLGDKVPFARGLAEVKGKTIIDLLGIEQNSPNADQARIAGSGTFQHFDLSNGAVNIMALRFPFSASGEREMPLEGDISIETEHLQYALHVPKTYPALAPDADDWNAMAEDKRLWSAFFRRSITPVLVKSKDTKKIVWANAAFEYLVQQFYDNIGQPRPKSLVGKTSHDLFGDEVDVRLDGFEQMAMSGKHPNLACEALLGLPRMSVRFLTAAQKDDETFLGVISCTQPNLPTA